MNEQMILQFANAAQVSPDRTGRLAALMQNTAERPLAVTAFGGSVTYGYHEAQKLVPYPELFCEKLPCRTKCTNLAASGTNAWLGLYLAAQFAETLHPDLVFLEYAVNQSSTREMVSAYESLLCRLLTLPEQPAVIAVMCENQSGDSSESSLTHVAQHYGVPVISVHAGLPGIPWEAYACDAVHPTAEGQAMLAEAAWHVLQCATPAKEPCCLPMPCLDRSAAGLTICPLQNGAGGLREQTPFLSLLGQADAVILMRGADTFYIEAEGDAFLFIFRQSCFADTSNAAVTVDGDAPITLHASVLSGWGNPFVQRIIPREKRTTHTITIQHDGGAGRFILWGIAAYRIRKEDVI